MTSQIRQNYHSDCEAAINKQINMELTASYIYQSMAWYFDRDDVALHGFYEFFSDASKDEREHAETLMRYQNKRGGRIVLQGIQKPERDDWGSGLEAMQTALGLEKKVNQSLLDLHGIASKHEDAHLGDFIEENYLQMQVEEIKKIADYVTQLTKMGPGLGEWTFDHEVLKASYHHGHAPPPEKTSS